MKHKCYTLVLILTVLILMLSFVPYESVTAISSPDILWSTTFDSGHTDVSNDVATDSENNIIVAGYTQTGTTNNVHIIKYNKDGIELYNITEKTPSNSEAKAIAIDSQDNIIAAGYIFNGTLLKDIYILKYNKNGQLLWNKTYSTSSNDIAYDIAVDTNDNIIITGVSNENYITLKYASNNNLKWKKIYDGGKKDCAKGITIDNQNNIIITGTKETTSSRDWHTIKYSSDNNTLWSRTFTNGWYNSADAVTIDNYNDVIVTGYRFKNDNDILTIKYNGNNGTTIWNNTFDRNSDDNGYDITINKNDDILIGGASNTYGRKLDFCILCYSHNGNLKWNKIYDHGQNEDDIIYGITTDNFNKIIVTGPSNEEGCTWPYNYLTIKFNKNPIANFTYSPSNPTDLDLIQFTDQSSDPAGEIISWQWDFGDGNTSTLQNPTHTYKYNGDYLVTLTVTDDDGKINSTSKVISVNNIEPNTNFTWDPFQPNQKHDKVTFTSTSTDIDGYIVNWTWNLGNGIIKYGKIINHTYHDSGSYQVNLTVQDDDGAKKSKIRIINVTNTPPLANYNWTPLEPNQITDQLTIISNSSDTDGNIVNWTWNLDDGNIKHGQTINHIYKDTGSYQVELTVTDDDRATDSKTYTINVLNTKPTASFTYTPTSPDTTTQIQFIDNSTDSDGTIDSWYWDFGDSNTSTNKNPTHSYADNGVYTVFLTVWDDDGIGDSYAIEVIVSNVPPYANFSYNPSLPDTSTQINFNDNSSDSDGNPVAWYWVFDDGATSTLQNPTHQYTDDGIYFVKLTVWDDDGATNTKIKPVQVGNVGPTASFTYTPSSPKDTDNIQFTDTSTDSDGTITNWLWNFGDGHTSTTQHPTHNYADNDTYVVTLTVWDDDNANDTTTQTLNVANDPPHADFTYNPSNPTDLQTIQFTDNSTDQDGTITSWQWNFGDSTTSTMQNPTHSYADNGIYTVTLTVTDDDGSQDTISKDVDVANVPPIADYTYNSAEPDTSDTIQFNDNSTDPDGYIGAWFWDFGDGNTSTEQNPTHNYADNGTYNVTLTVEDNDGDQDSDTLPMCVKNVAPTAAFNYTPLSPTTSSTIQFYDQSTDSDGTIVYWTWEFIHVTTGTSTQSHEQNPTLNPIDDGKYLVYLTVWDDDGKKDEIVQDIQVSNIPPVANFTWNPTNPTDTEDIQFSDTSTDIDGTVTQWHWDFDDGNTSTQQNPTHNYADDGTYHIKLTVWDNDGDQHNITKELRVSNVGPTADFTWTPTIPTDTESVQFTDTSTDSDGTIDQWQWDFGDGHTATTQHPQHQYADNGTYTITLKIWDDDGENDTISKQITITNVPPTADFTWTPATPSTADTIQFTDTSTDQDGTIVAWNWDFGDTSTSTMQHPTHSYADDGTYTVTLQIWDNDGATHTTQQQIHVTNVAPTADFTWTPTSPTDLDTVEFTDNSSDSDGSITSWHWSFGDGFSSTDQHPDHQYADEGTYTVTLTVWDDDTGIDTISKDIIVSNVPPQASYTYTPTSPDTSTMIQFTDTSIDVDGTITEWHWVFDDGATSNLQNPTHQYTDNGTYHVTLTVTDEDGDSNSTTQQINVANMPPTADFSYTPLAPDTSINIGFTDLSTDSDGTVVDWQWNFGDGNTSADQNPSHSYADDGTYTVSLTVTDDDGSQDTITKDVDVANVPPTADFNWNPVNPTDIDDIQFTDHSTDSDGTIDQWEWNFGDGNTSTEQHPTHNYADDDTYHVTLTIWDDDGDQDTISKYVTVSNVPPTADFTWAPSSPTDLDDIQFTDTSTDQDGIITEWHWDFGDGHTATTQHPTHNYADEGTYTVTLTVTDDDNAENTTSQQIIVNNVAPTADFTWTPPVPTDTETVQFTDHSTDSDGTIEEWLWNFGDGNTATTQHPTHNYADNGTYTVTLTITDDDDATNTTSKQITITNVPPTADFTWTPTIPTDVEPVQFTDHSTDSDGTIDQWQWNFGDGNTSTEPNPMHQYADNGVYTITLTVTDNDGDTNTTTEQITVQNVPPTADFTYTPQVIFTSDPISFTENSSDIDGTITNYTWTFDDGYTSYDQHPQHAYTENGTYNVTLTIRDNDGAPNSTYKHITVFNRAPVPDFTWSPTSPTDLETVQFTDNSTDPDGTIANWTWHFGDGNTSYDQHPQHNYADNGTYTVTLTIRDNDDNTSSINKDITIDNVPPTPDFTWTPLTPNQKTDTVTFNSTTSYDPDGTITEWHWDFGDNTTSTQENPTHIYNDSGNYTITLTITDNDGDTNTTNKTITINNTPPSPNFSWTPTNPTDMQIVNFTDESTDIDGDIVAWQWNFSDPRPANDQHPHHLFVDNGTYHVILTIWDDDGANATITKDITIYNVPPTANFTWTPSPSSRDNHSKLFTSTATDIDGSITNYTWTIEGNQYYGQNIIYNFTAKGPYTINLTVTDDDNASHSIEHSLVIMAKYEYCPINHITVGEELKFFDQSMALEGTIVNRTWDFDDGTILTSNETHPLQKTQHTYTENGTYYVTLTVVDDVGNTDSYQRKITVGSASEPVEPEEETPQDDPLAILDVTVTPQTQWIDNHVNITTTLQGHIIVAKVNIQKDNTTICSNHVLTKAHDNHYYLNQTYDVAGNYSFYIWAKNISTNETMSQLYYFNIIDNHPPNTPSNPSPADNAAEVNTNTGLSWTGGDQDNDPLSYKVYFGTTTTPSLLGTTPETYFDPGALHAETTYYWYIIADDGETTTQGPLWQFTTGETANQPPAKPSKPSGPSSGTTGTSYTFEASTTDPDGHALKYRFDWDDGTTSDTSYYASGTTVSKAHSWDTASTYQVSVKAYDGEAWSSWSNSKSITINEPTQPSENQAPQKPTTPEGPTTGEVNTQYAFSTSTTDPDGDDIYYQFSWDDGTTSSWLGPYDSGDTVDITHSWSVAGNYDVKARARDTEDATSTWSTPHTIEIEGVPTGNQPPSRPNTPSGPTTGTTNTSYTFTTSAADPDNDQIKYLFDWDDNTTDWTTLTASGTIASQSHAWTTPGTYQIRVKAQDTEEHETTWSNTHTITITAPEDDSDEDGVPDDQDPQPNNPDNVHQITIKGTIYYLVDNDDDGVYDELYNPQTKKKNDVKHQNGDYLIDIDDDGTWDYVFNLETETYTEYEEEDQLGGWLPYIIGGLLLLALLILLLLFFFTRRRKPVVTKNAACPKCDHTVHVTGREGKLVSTTCPECHTRGAVQL